MAAKDYHPVTVHSTGRPSYPLLSSGRFKSVGWRPTGGLL